MLAALYGGFKAGLRRPAPAPPLLRHYGLPRPGSTRPRQSGAKYRVGARPRARRNMLVKALGLA
jgi:hypothetical protein